MDTKAALEVTQGGGRGSGKGRQMGVFAPQLEELYFSLLSTLIF